LTPIYSTLQYNHRVILSAFFLIKKIPLVRSTNHYQTKRFLGLIPAVHAFPYKSVLLSMPLLPYAANHSLHRRIQIPSNRKLNALP